MYDQNQHTNSEENIFRILASKLLPYWPLFVFLTIFLLSISWVYLKFKTPIYQASATLIIKDKNKGVDDAKLVESINPFESKKIVENEIEVINSRAVLTNVVKDLHLYAPVYKKKLLKDVPVYAPPVQIQLKNPDILNSISQKLIKKYPITYDSSIKKVIINENSYPVNQWVTSSLFGEIKYVLKDDNTASINDEYYYTFINPNQLAIDLSGGIEVNAINQVSTVVRLTYKDPNPKKAEEILNQVIKAYNQKGVDDRNQLAANTLEFIEERMNNVEKELNNLEIEIQEFRSSEGLVNISEQGKLYLENVGDYDRQIADINRQISVLQKVERYVISKKNKGGLVPSTIGINDPVLSQLLEKLYNSELEYEKLKNTTGANNPILLSITKEINKIRPSILENIRSHKNNLNASLGNLNLNSDKSNSELKTLPEKERALLAITRKKTIKNELFVFLQQKREETALSYAPNDGETKIVDLAQSSPSPVSPRKTIIYFLTLVASFSIGLTYIIGKEMLNSNVLFRSEIENNTNIPVISELPFVNFENGTNTKKSIDQIFLQKIIFVCNKLGFGKFLNLKNQKQVLIQQGEAVLPDYFRQLGVELGLYSKEFTKQKILVTSSIPGEGKSFVCTNLSYCLAQSGKKVILIDMDFIRAETTKSFNLENEHGLTDYLNDLHNLNKIIAKSPINKNLSIIPVGTIIEDYTHLLLNGKINKLFNELSGLYDYIIIDSAPVNLVADVNLLTHFSDKTLYIVRHDHTPLNAIKHLKHNLNPNIKDIGIVFNGVKRRGFINEEFSSGYGYSLNKEYTYSYKKQ
ncbi:polysaccharide biosynthesis tyrosine autokinase [uncultured Maribacter sp.]|uniref:GumC family protein n=1 Tax=uncultured Maribacter sp. TaxID=431308 RepID=UPI002605AFCC|nr:polysaccharide biosynthesis tyrosine autokinase [uncultured Maribacter sp.]